MADHPLDRDQFAFHNVTDLLLQAESLMDRAKSAAYFLRKDPDYKAALDTECRAIKGRIISLRGNL